MTDPILYLILHKVSGIPAYDIAYRMCGGTPPCQPDCGLFNPTTGKCLAKEEDWWVVSTSGHRAYPLYYWLLEDLADVSDYPHQRPAFATYTDPDFDALPDHYTVRAEATAKLTGLLEKLGLKRRTNIEVRPL